MCRLPVKTSRFKRHDFCGNLFSFFHFIAHNVELPKCLVPSFSKLGILYTFFSIRFLASSNFISLNSDLKIISFTYKRSFAEILDVNKLRLKYKKFQAETAEIAHPIFDRKVICVFHSNINLNLQIYRSPSSKICLKKKDGLTFDSFAISEVFQKFYSNLASNLVDKLPAAVNKFGLHSVEVYYKNVLQFQENKFIFHTIESSSVLSLLKNVEVNKADGIHIISARFLKYGASILAISVTRICNLSIKLSHFSHDCKLAKFKPLHKKGPKTDPKNYRPISI